jgi:DNA-binding response OmpR family regulator
MSVGMSVGMSARPTVLVVEDDVHIAQVLAFMLERQGYQVTHVADDFIIKPFQPQELLARLRRFLKNNGP